MAWVASLKLCVGLSVAIVAGCTGADSADSQPVACQLAQRSHRVSCDDYRDIMRMPASHERPAHLVFTGEVIRNGRHFLACDGRLALYWQEPGSQEVGSVLSRAAATGHDVRAVLHWRGSYVVDGPIICTVVSVVSERECAPR